MSTLPRPTGKDLLRALERAGFATERIRGRHHFVRHPDGPRSRSSSSHSHTETRAVAEDLGRLRHQAGATPGFVVKRGNAGAVESRKQQNNRTSQGYELRCSVLPAVTRSRARCL